MCGIVGEYYFDASQTNSADLLWMGVRAPLADSFDRLLDARAGVDAGKLSRLISEQKSGFVDYVDTLWLLKNHAIRKDKFAINQDYCS